MTPATPEESETPWTCSASLGPFGIASGPLAFTIGLCSISLCSIGLCSVGTFQVGCYVLL
jgi:hypothetical protein